EFDDIAVLYRANFQSRYIEESFSQHKIPYVIENGLNFYQRSEVKVLIDYLKLINNPNTDEADEALQNVINFPLRYCGRNFVKNLEQYASEHEIHLFEALSQIKIELKYVQKNVQEFLSLLSPLIKDAESLEPAEALLLLREALDYDRLISEDDIPAPDDNRLENVNQLTLAAAKYSSIESFLDYTESFQGVASGDKSGIHLMTIHKAKGLEFETVFVVGMVEGILPSKRGDKEEERRIAFVGISRAMKLLYLSYTCNYLGQSCKKSLFIDEILGNV
ncbi:3'-5' exonuclease, partial [candidate division KSB1 bacterium]